MLYDFTLRTEREGFYNITPQVNEALQKSEVKSGVCLVHCPHTTAGITINENADPHVVQDMLLALREAFPDRPAFLHAEGNSAAHCKASCIGSGVMIPVEKGRLVFGTWQAVYFCEFDGPRSRWFNVKVIAG